MKNQTAIFAILAVASYVLAFITSDVLVRWILPRRLSDELGRGKRFIAIDGIRGYLAFGVYLHHSLITWIYLATSKWTPPPHNFENELGRGAVAIFFMITAFLFWGRAYARKDLDSSAFFISRLFRIYPLYLFVVMMVCLFAAWKSHWIALESGGEISKEITNWLLFRYPDINGYKDTGMIVAFVTWTLLYEAWFYLSLPLMVMIFLKKNAVWKKALALTIIVFLLKLIHLNPRVAATFLGGILAVYWRTSPKLLEWAKGRAAASIAVICIACVVFFRYEAFSAVSIALLSVFFVVIASGNTLFGILEMRGALWLGEASYSIYLCHGIVLWVLIQNVFTRMTNFHLTNGWLALSMLGLTPIVVLSSSATYIFLERPFIEAGRRLANGKQAK